MSDSSNTVAILFLAVFIFVVFTLIYFCLRKKKDSGYRQVLEGDELDEEELAFKKSLEEQDEEFGNDEELEFDDKELAQLRMLDEYREDIMNDEEGIEEEEAEDLESDAKTKKTVEMTAKKHKQKDDSDSLGKTSDKKNDGPDLKIKIGLPHMDNEKHGSAPSSPNLVKRHSPRISGKKSIFLLRNGYCLKEEFPPYTFFSGDAM